MKIDIQKSMAYRKQFKEQPKQQIKYIITWIYVE